LEEAKTERSQLQHIVDSQEISPADVDRMHAEREQLTKSLEQANEKNEFITKQIWEREIECQKKLDQVRCSMATYLRQVEKLVLEFNSKAYRLELIPTTARFAEGENFEVILNGHATRADQMVSIDLRGIVKVI
jgi:kinetochore protein NDC80